MAPRFSQGKDSLEDDVRTDLLQIVRINRKIPEFGTFVRANRSQSVDDLAAAIGSAKVIA